VGQALHLNNGKTLNDKLRAPSSRLAEWVEEKVSDDEAVGRIYLLALCRQPTPAEKAAFRKLMDEAGREGATRREVLEDVFWSVLTSKEFVFNH
jgi:hypothetical protein